MKNIFFGRTSLSSKKPFSISKSAIVTQSMKNGQKVNILVKAGQKINIGKKRELVFRQPTKEQKTEIKNNLFGDEYYSEIKDNLKYLLK